MDTLRDRIVPPTARATAWRVTCLIAAILAGLAVAAHGQIPQVEGTVLPVVEPAVEPDGAQEVESFYGLLFDEDDRLGFSSGIVGEVDWTFEAWVWVDAGQTESGIWSAAPVGGVDFSAGILIANSAGAGLKLQVYGLMTGGALYAPAADYWEMDTWVHCAVTYDNSSGLISVYKNGAFFDSSTETSGVTFGDHAGREWLMMRQFESSLAQGMAGKVAQARWYLSVRTSDQIAVDYLSTRANGSPCTEFMMTPGSGTTVLDLSGNGNSGAFAAGGAAPSWIVPAYTKTTADGPE